MKSPAIVTAAVLLAACSQPGSKSTEVSQNSEKTIEVAKASKKAPNAQATCKRGALDEVRSFIVCEDGTLRKAGVLNALSAPNDPDLKIETVAAQYGVQSQVFTGIETASAVTSTNPNGKSAKQNGKFRSREGLVQIQDKIYEVYLVSSEEKTGTVFIEREGSL